MATKSHMYETQGGEPFLRKINMKRRIRKTLKEEEKFMSASVCVSR